MTLKTRVLFLCVANAARSQMAEALLRHTDPDGYEVCSAGTQPSAVDPRARLALEQLGVSTDGLHSKALEQFDGQQFDYVITLCDKSAFECSTLPVAGSISTTLVLAVVAWLPSDKSSLVSTLTVVLLPGVLPLLSSLVATGTASEYWAVTVASSLSPVLISVRV